MEARNTHEPHDRRLGGPNRYTAISTWWDNCPNSRDILEFLELIGYKNDRVLRLISCRFVREVQISNTQTVWDLLDDERSRDSVIIAERWANGDASDKELTAAWLGARKVVSETADNEEIGTPAQNAKDYARIAASEPSGGKAYGCALLSAWCTTCVATYSAADEGADKKVRLQTLSQQADIIREMIPIEDVKQLLKLETLRLLMLFLHKEEQ